MKNYLIPSLTVAILAVAMFFQVNAPKTTVGEAPVGRLVEIDGYSSEVIPAGEAELNILPADTFLDKRVYTDDVGRWFAVTLVIGGTSKSSIHRPELCLPSQGFLMVSPRTLGVNGIDWRAITLRNPAGVGDLGFAYTFYNQVGYRTASHMRRIFKDAWDRSVYCRIDRWAMITVHSSVADDRELSKFLGKLEGVMK